MPTRMNLLLVASIITLMGGVLVFFGFSCSAKQDLIPKPDLTLDNYVDLFQNDTMIIVGEGASEIELESVDALAGDLIEVAGNAPIAKKDSAVSKEDKASHNLILIGTPRSNTLLSEVYRKTNATEVTEEYPGENKGKVSVMSGEIAVFGGGRVCYTPLAGAVSQCVGAMFNMRSSFLFY